MIKEKIFAERDSSNDEYLKVIEIYANEGKTTKRFRARARGRSARIFRRNSHITVVVDQKEAVN